MLPGKSSPSEFSTWMRKELLGSWEGLITQDIDVIVFDRSLSSFILIEEKDSGRAAVTVPQAICFKMLNELLKLQDECRYCGSYLIYYLGNSAIYINPPLTRVQGKSGYRPNLKERKIPSINEETLKSLICDDFTRLEEEFERDWYSFIIEENIPYLWNCKGDSPNIGTRKEISHWRGSRILALRDCNNKMSHIDWIFINYCTGYFVLIKERQNIRRNYKPEGEDSQLIDKIHRIFENANDKNRKLRPEDKVKNPKTEVPYEYLGYFLVEFDGNGPKDSKKIYLNHNEIEIGMLKNFLNLDNREQIEEITKEYACEWWKRYAGQADPPIYSRGSKL